MVILDQTELSESERRLFRKKRARLMKRRTRFKRLLQGVYFISCENPSPPPPSLVPLSLIREIMQLVGRFHVKADYFLATQVELEETEEGSIFDEEGRLDISLLKSYFIFKPIKIQTAPESEFTEEASSQSKGVC